MITPGFTLDRFIQKELIVFKTLKDALFSFFYIAFTSGNIPTDKVSNETLQVTGLAAGRVGYDGTEAGINEALIEGDGALFYGAYEQLVPTTTKWTDWLYGVNVVLSSNGMTSPVVGADFAPAKYNLLAKTVRNLRAPLTTGSFLTGDKYTATVWILPIVTAKIVFRVEGSGGQEPNNEFILDVVDGWQEIEIHGSLSVSHTFLQLCMFDFSGDIGDRFWVTGFNLTMGAAEYPYQENNTGAMLVIPENNSSIDRGIKVEYSKMPKLLEALYGTDGTNAEGKLNVSWCPMYNASEVTGTVNILTTDDGVTNTLYYDADNNLLKLTDGTNVSQIACTPVADTTYNIVGNWDVSGGLQISLDSVDGSLASFAGRFPTEDEMSFAWEADAPQYIKLISIEKESLFYYRLADEDGNILTDEDGNHLTER